MLHLTWLCINNCVCCALNECFCSLQIQDGKGDVTITNDGATILKQMQVLHPAAKMVHPSIKMKVFVLD